MPSAAIYFFISLSLCEKILSHERNNDCHIMCLIGDSMASLDIYCLGRGLIGRVCFLRLNIIPLYISYR